MPLLYTLLLVLKSLFPFLREIIFKDKGVREFLLGNKPATGLAACLLVMFLLFYYAKLVAEFTHVRNTALTAENATLVKSNADQLVLIGVLEDRLSKKATFKVAVPVQQPTPTPTTPPKPDAVTHKPREPKPSMRTYVIGRFKSID